VIADLDAFYLAHRCCGDLDADVVETKPGSYLVWMTCTLSCELWADSLVNGRSADRE
jgi:hypothetical protein